jgi:RNA polymerase sigma-70 factor (ECF subfamily)
VRSDESLILAYRAGAREAFDELFERYRERVWRFFRRRVDDPARAEELTQDTFLAVLQAADRYEPRATFRSYLFGIAFNLLAAARRQFARAHADPVVNEPAAPAFDPIAGLWVRQALATLDPRDRDILMLREYEQLSYDEIGSLLGLPPGTVRSRLFRARLALKTELRPPQAAKEVRR